MEKNNIENLKLDILKLKAITDYPKDIFYKYCGEVDNNNKPHGYGIGIFEHNKHCGLWKNGIQHGEVIKYIKQKNYEIKYIGYFEGCNIINKGKILINNKLYYEGHIDLNKLHGDGITYYNNNVVKSIGRWNHDLKDGKFKDFDNNGNLIYNGEYKNNNKEGNGEMYDINFNKHIPIYSGTWKENKYNGNGKLYILNLKNYYIGEFKEGKKEGKGKLINNNTYYEGNFKNDKKDGFGIYYKYNSNKSKKYEIKYEGIFEIDNIINGKCTYKNNDIYEGQFKNNLKHGYGEFIINKTGIIYKGYWKNGLKNGTGILIDENKITFKTEWEDNKLKSKKRCNNNINLDEIKKSKKIPDEFKCPISLDIMLNPVIASDGFTYDLISLENLFKKNKTVVSPLTREVLNKDIKIPNINLKKLINDNI